MADAAFLGAVLRWTLVLLPRGRSVRRCCAAPCPHLSTSVTRRRRWSPLGGMQELRRYCAGTRTGAGDRSVVKKRPSAVSLRAQPCRHDVSTSDRAEPIAHGTTAP